MGRVSEPAPQLWAGFRHQHLSCELSFSTRTSALTPAAAAAARCQPFARRRRSATACGPCLPARTRHRQSHNQSEASPRGLRMCRARLMLAEKSGAGRARTAAPCPRSHHQCCITTNQMCKMWTAARWPRRAPTSMSTAAAGPGPGPPSCSLTCRPLLGRGGLWCHLALPLTLGSQAAMALATLNPKHWPPGQPWQHTS